MNMRQDQLDKIENLCFTVSSHQPIGPMTRKEETVKSLSAFSGIIRFINLHCKFSGIILEQSTGIQMMNGNPTVEIRSMQLQDSV